MKESVLKQKAFPEAIPADRIEGLGLVPYSLKLKELNQLNNLNPSVEALPKAAMAADGIEGVGGKTDASGSEGIINPVMILGPKFRF
jgi:hypothetical protein